MGKHKVKPDWNQKGGERMKKLGQIVIAWAGIMSISGLSWATGTADSNVSGIFDNIGATVLAILKGAGVIAGGAFCIINIVVGINTKQPGKVVGGVLGLIILGSLVAIITALQRSAGA